MDGLSAAAASVIAVIDISAKVASTCYQYIDAVKNAAKDIQRLQKKADSIGQILGQLKLLLEGPNGRRLHATHELVASLEECLTLLGELDTAGAKQDSQGDESIWKASSEVVFYKQANRRDGHQTREIRAELPSVAPTRSNVIVAPSADLLGEFVNKVCRVLCATLLEKIDLAKLPVARSASFSSHLEEHNSTCLANTRVEIRRQITDWAEARDGKHIFWLSGMAGTGKSTIARTVAQSFADQGQLGASFFFKRGEGERGNASRFFTTVASDLMTYIPRLKPIISEVIEVEPAIAEKALKDQFDKLVLDPLTEIGQTPFQGKEFVIVIDALDECDREEDIRAILRLLARTRDITTISLRVFITSRPELPIRLGFKQMPDGTYQDLVLHEVAKDTIAQDIALFFENEIANIREQRSLDLLWPGEQSIQILVEMAVPLFIFAATVCRFLAEGNGNPRRRLKDILAYDTDDIPKQDLTYLPIMNHLFTGQGEREKEKLSKEFRDIVGSIVLLESPLSIVSIAKILDIPEEDISCRIDSLHSVLNIPGDKAGPIRLLHLSFRDFLTDPEKCGKRPFWVDEQKAHKMLAEKCLQLMSSPDGLRQNICNLPTPGTLREEIDNRILQESLSPELRYACRYWVTHLQRGKCKSHDIEQVPKFLQTYALLWLEAMSLMGMVSESIYMIIDLQSCTEVSFL